jgi:hypothetical protein
MFGEQRFSRGIVCKNLLIIYGIRFKYASTAAGYDDNEDQLRSISFSNQGNANAQVDLFVVAVLHSTKRTTLVHCMRVVY